MTTNNNKFLSPEFLQKEALFLKKHSLKKIANDDGFIIDKIPYASKNNFCKEELYSHSFIYIHQEAYKELKRIQLGAEKLGFKIKIFDGYRPFEVQSHMANKFPQYVKDGYVSHPKEGIATHVRAIAVDLTLLDKNGEELDMGTKFDEMDEKSFHNSQKITKEQKQNRKILLEIMTGEESKFEMYPNEWWHYNLKIFKYNDNKEIIGAEEEASKKYPKIPEGEFNDLLSSNLLNIVKISQKN